MKLTVFGATGGVGGHVVLQALDAGHTVTAVVRNPDRLDPDRLDLAHPALRIATVPDLTDYQRVSGPGGQWRTALYRGERCAGGTCARR